MKSLIAITLLLACGGCVTPTPKMAATMVQQSVQTASAEDLSRAYGAFRSPAVRDELTRRGVFDPETWRLIDQRRVVRGMPADAVLAAWGRPDDIDRKTRRRIATDTWIYGRMDQTTRTLVFFDRARLVQNFDG